jgi:inner membrane protein
MHYILVGLAISIFYILLLSLSEHIGFNLAYILSAWAVVGLIGIYTTSIVKSRYLVLMLAGILASIFGFIFIILQLEDFALLAGSIGLFVVLAIVMYYSRNIDWNKVGKSEVEVQPEME